MLTVGSRALGIPETQWLACAQLGQAPAMDWGAPRRVAVIAPHPDDEVLAVGGIMRMLARAGVELAILAITDGEASHPRSPTIAPDRLAVHRAQERAAALEQLGVAAPVVRFGYPDGHVHRSNQLIDRIARAIHGADWCLAPWELDGHPDHDATGRAAFAACAATGVRLARYPVWAWHWAAPTAAMWPWGWVRRIDLDRDTLDAKRAAIAAYRSQIAPLSTAVGDEAILPPEVVARFTRPFEVVLV